MRRLHIVALLAGLVPTSPCSAQPTAPAIAVPQPEVLLVLIRTAMSALDHANKTGNYSVLRELGGPGMQASSSGQLGHLFAALRNSGVDLSPALVVTPQLTETPAITPAGQLNLIGTFPTSPSQITFQIVYQPVAGQWRLFGLSVSVIPVTGAAAPAAPPPTASATKSDANGAAKKAAAPAPTDKAPAKQK
jgi:hypothetical protein